MNTHTHALTCSHTLYKGVLTDRCRDVWWWRGVAFKEPAPRRRGPLTQATPSAGAGAPVCCGNVYWSAPSPRLPPGWAGPHGFSGSTDSGPERSPVEGTDTRTHTRKRTQREENKNAVYIEFRNLLEGIQWMYVDGGMNALMDEWMDGWIKGKRPGWINGRRIHGQITHFALLGKIIIR